MDHKPTFLIIIILFFLPLLLVGCSSTPAQIPPTPDPSIVWSDNFDDGNPDGWEKGWQTDEYIVNDGELVLEHFDDYPFAAVSVLFNSCCSGPALDNVVVRNQVIDIQPTE